MTYNELMAALRDELAAHALITEAHALEAYHSVLKPIRTEGDAAHFFASMNLLNAYVKNEAASADFAKQYHFKNYVVDAIEQIARQPIPGIDIYIDRDVIYVWAQGLQFSFHNLRLTRTLIAYRDSPANVPQEWTGIRLQPPAVTVMEWTKAVREGR